MQVYINYPQPHITVHRDSSCRQVQKHHKEGQRHIRVRPQNLEAVLNEFANGEYEFKSQPEFNDLWLDISLDTYEQEIGLIHKLQSIIGKRYKPLSNAPITIHCE